jgi:phosphoribosyl 1,2-cyclic phosphodiesterase
MMQLSFPGTRGNIEASSPHHARHSAMRIVSGDQRLWIDCGLDWLDDIPALPVDAILLTHAHPDHAFGLQNGAPCPVYATAETGGHLAGFAIEQPRLLLPGHPEIFGELKIAAIPVLHSFRAPTVALRIGNGRSTLFYAPDIAGLPEYARTLAGIDLYIGDGAAFDDSLLRIERDTLCGHAPIDQQLDWCAEAGVPRALFTHCGEQIVSGNDYELQERIRSLGGKRGIEVVIAWDGMEMTLG